MRTSPILLASCLLTLGVSCGWSAAGKTTDDTGDSGDTGHAGSDSGVDDSDAPQDSDEPEDPEQTDDDGDGHSELDGDCDDADSSVFPGAEDSCDRIDQDCDGQVDEDAAADDPYEPNDDGAWGMGSLEDDPEHSFAGRFHNDDDIDRYAFTVVDSFWDDFTVTMTLSGISDDTSVRLTLNRLRTDGSQELGEVAHVAGRGDQQLLLEDASGPEDGGDYEVVAQAVNNVDCSALYELSVTLD